MAEAQEPHKPPPDRSRRAVVIATLGIVLILAVALYVGTVLLPFLQTRAALRSGQNAFERLGGNERAGERLVAYLRWPDWAAPDKEAAIHNLWWLGEAAERPLLRVIEDPNPKIRQYAARALGGEVIGMIVDEDGREHGRDIRLGVDPAVAVPALERALEDENPDVRKAAAKALKKIRAAEEPGG